MPARLEDLPSQDALVREFFQPFLGRKLTAVVEHFRPLIRNAVAHLDPAQDVLDIDRYEDVTTCERAVPVLRYMAHRFITAELEHHRPRRSPAPDFRCAPNKGVQLTAYSVRCAPAFGSS